MDSARMANSCAAEPKVSICLPNLNSRPFLEARMRSILSQTFTSWELVVVDGYSDDGSWALLQEHAAREPRLRICQTPREGVYAALNECIRQAHGEYIYIATADDTMTPDCLEKMVAALEAHPECGLCHCCLTFIDEQGVPLPEAEQWRHSRVCRYFGDLMNKHHIRRAPHDAVLHSGLTSIYHSLTQLLIRRKVLDELGLFRTDRGSFADFEWNMRASFVFDTIHVPEFLATWRVHAGQATADTDTSESRLRLLEMIEDASRAAEPHAVRKIPRSALTLPYEFEYVAMGWQERESPGARAAFLARAAARFPLATLRWLAFSLRWGAPTPFWSVRHMRAQIRKLGLQSAVEPCGDS